MLLLLFVCVAIFRYDVTDVGPEDVYFCSDACFTEFDDARKSVGIRISKVRTHFSCVLIRIQINVLQIKFHVYF